MSLVLATGGLGFIGSHTCISLIENGYDVLIIDSLINSYEETFLKLKKIIHLNKKAKKGKLFFIKGDLNNKNLLDKIFQEKISEGYPIKSVIHFAGLKSVAGSVLDPIKYWDTNINITMNVLSIMDKYNCNNFVFSSSATIYKPIDSGKLLETYEKTPLNPYGNTKLAIETILSDVFKSNKSKWKIVNLRYFNPIGAHPTGLIGDLPKENSSNLFPVISKVIFGKSKKLSVFGSNWPTKDGTCIRDFIHIIDLADAHVAALNYLEKNDPQILSINIGTGKGYSVLEIIKTFSKINKVELPHNFVKKRKGDVPYLVADNKLALELLDWSPKKSLELMCKDSFNFFKKNVFKISNSQLKTRKSI